MTKRATITVKGTVQHVGFRRKVKDIAAKLHLSGQAENAGRGTVRIICEGEESDILELQRRFKTRNGLTRIRSTRPVFTKPKGDFRGFRIIREKDFEKAVFEKLDAGVGHLKKINLRLDGINSGIRKLDTGIKGVKSGIKGINSGIRKLDTGVKGVKSGIGKMDSHMAGHFDRLDKKYDAFGATMLQVAEDIHSIKDDLHATVQEIRRPRSA